MSGRPPRARTAIGAVLPQDPHWRLPRPLRRRQTSHRGCPPAVRVATGLTLPQPLQGSASCQARQRWQTPPSSLRNSGFPVRPHAAHAGTARVAEPRAISSVRATGGAPAASAPGSAASRSQLEQRLPARGHRPGCGFDHRPGQRALRCDRQVHDPVMLAPRTALAPGRWPEFVAGRAPASHRAMAPGWTAPSPGAGAVAAIARATRAACPAAPR